MASSIDSKKLNELKTQLDGVIYFLQQLDIEMIDSILDSHRTYQDFYKHVFINKLGHALDQFINSGDTYLNCYSGFCNSEICNYQCKGFSFVGNHSGKYLDLIIDSKDGVVQDMYECNVFRNSDKGVVKGKRVLIDNPEIVV